MTHPLRRTASTSPPPPSRDAVALDLALDAWVRGDDSALNTLDAGMEDTIAQLYAWADVAGIPDEPTASPDTRTQRSHPDHPHGPRPMAQIGSTDPHDRRSSRTMSRRTRIMTAFSGLAAALLIGLSIYGAVPLFTDRQNDPTPSEIAFQAGTPSDPATPAATAPAPTRDVPTDLIFQGGDPISAGGDQTVLPPVGTELTGAWGVDALNPVRPEECDVTPMTRDEATTILTTPPSSDQQPYRSDSTVDEATMSAVQASFRQWQACRRSGNTFGAMALETDAFIRADLYDDGGAMASFPRADVAFSPEVASGVLDVRVSIDEQRKTISDKQAGDRPGSEGGLDLNLWIIDMQQMPYATSTGETLPAGTYAAGEDGTYVWAVAIWTNPNVSSDQPYPRVAVAFKQVDGVWKLDQWRLLGGLPSSGS